MKRTLARLAAVTMCAACHPMASIVVGPAAAARFVYRGQPIQPLCLNFSFERASLKPIPLATCTGRAPVMTDERGWLTADFPPAAGRGSLSYRVLAAKGGAERTPVRHRGSRAGDKSSMHRGSRICIEADTRVALALGIPLGKIHEPRAKSAVSSVMAPSHTSPSASMNSRPASTSSATVSRVGYTASHLYSH